MPYTRPLYTYSFSIAFPFRNLLFINLSPVDLAWAVRYVRLLRLHGGSQVSSAKDPGEPLCDRRTIRGAEGKDADGKRGQSVMIKKPVSTSNTDAFVILPRRIPD